MATATAPAAAVAAADPPAAAAPTQPIRAPAHPTYDIDQAIRAALAEDAGDRGDVTTLATVEPSACADAVFIAKAAGVLAGLEVADRVFAAVDPELKAEWAVGDGARVAVGDVIGRVRGPTRSVLVAERVALNFMQRMSGIATATAAMVAAVAGTGTRILETRKTAPGLRLPDKWAVLLGGGANHRMGLYDMMMIKDNHIAAAGGIAAALARAEAYIAREGLAGRIAVELETRTLGELDEALALLRAGAAPHVSRIMLDNMARRDPTAPYGVDVSMLQAAMARVSAYNTEVAGDCDGPPGDGSSGSGNNNDDDGSSQQRQQQPHRRRRRVESEASGNVTLETVRAFAEAGVDFVSVGALTHSVTALDISLNIETTANAQQQQQ